MLKKTASFVLGSSKSSTYPTWETSCLGSSGWAGEESYASGFDSPAALLTAFLNILRRILTEFVAVNVSMASG